MTKAKSATKGTTTSAQASKGFSAEERSAMRERVKEMKAAAGMADGERDVLAKIAAMSAGDRRMAERVHALIKASVPGLSAKTWYGMPAYYKDGKVVCFFRNAGKFKERYAMFGFNDTAKLDEGSMWPVAFALTKLTAADEARIRALVKRAVA